VLRGQDIVRREHVEPDGTPRGVGLAHLRWRRTHVVGLALVVMTASAYSVMDVTAKLAYRAGLDIQTLLALRFLAAGGILALLVFAFGLRPRPTLSRSIRLLMLGGAGYALESFLLNSAIIRMPVSAVILIFYAYPAMIALLAVTLRNERLGAAKAFALGLSIVAVALLLSFPVHGMTRVGMLLSLGAAAAFAVYAFIAERAMTGVHPLAFSSLILLGAGGSVAAVGYVAGWRPTGLGIASGGWILLHTLLIGLAVVGFLGAMDQLGAVGAAVGNTLEPAITVVLSIAVLGERIGLLQIAGGVLLIVAISLLPLFRRGAPVSLGEDPMVAGGYLTPPPPRDA